MAMRLASLRNPWKSGVLFAILLVTLVAAPAEAQLAGAIFTTESACDGTNVNIFPSKEDVYLDGGPLHEGAAGLPNGEYYVQVTEPNGTLLGTSIGSADETPALVVGGEFAVCYQLSAILIKASDSSPGYDTTTNGGGEYKVWISQTSTFDGGTNKTDNFKVDETEPDSGTLEVIKFYDANVNGINDDGQELTGWEIHIVDGTEYVRSTPVSIIVAPDVYTVTESTPVEPNWVGTTDNPVIVDLAAGETETVEFGNVCLGGGGGHTLGFWSNKNGQATLNDPPCVANNCMASELALLSGLSLRNANGSDFDPGSYSALRTWLLNGTSVNMSYMLSVQLAAMALNVEAGLVDGGAVVYDGDGFVTIASLIAAADAELQADGDTPAGDEPNRSVQEALKNTLDAANNNQNFVQATPCPFSFASN
jgi:hypothetical protein